MSKSLPPSPNDGEPSTPKAANGVARLRPVGRMHDFLNMSDRCFWETDTDFVLSFVTPQIETLAGLSPQKLLGQRLDAGLAPVLYQADWDRFFDHLQTPDNDQPSQFTITVKVHVNDEHIGYRHLQLQAKKVLTKDDTLQGYRGSISDITSEVTNSINSQLIEKRLSDTIECLPYGITLFDRDDRLVFVNSKYREIFPELDDLMTSGAMFEDFVRESVKRRVHPVPEDRIEDYINCRMILHRNGYGTREVRLADNRWVELSEHITSEGGTIISWKDLTPMKRREQAMAMLLGEENSSWEIADRAAKALCIALGVRWAGVVQRHTDDHQRGELIAFWDEEKCLDHQFYNIDQAPCQEVYQGDGQVFFPKDVAEKYPNNPLDPNGAFTSYRGYLLRNAQGGIIGHIFAAHDKDIGDQAFDREGREAFNLIAYWVEMELRRRNVLDTMVDTQLRLRAFAESASDWLWEIDHTFKTSYISTASGRPFTKYIEDLLQDAHNDLSAADDLARAAEVAKHYEKRDQGMISAHTNLTPIKTEEYDRQTDPAVWMVGDDIDVLDAGDDDKDTKHLDIKNAHITAYHPFKGVSVQVRSPDTGELRTLKINGRPFFERGQFRGYRGTASDVTDFVSALDRAVEAEQWLSAAIENAPEAVALYDEKDRLIVCNQKFREAFFNGFEETVKLGMSFEQLMRRHLKLGLRDISEFEQAKWLKDQLERRGEHRALDDAVHTMVNGQSYLALEHKTNDGGIASFYVDITEIRENECMLRHAKEIAEAANRGKSEFLANISHELRTPLNSIIGFSELIREGYAGPTNSKRYLDYIQDIHASGTHLLELINDILDLSKAESGRLSQEAKPTHVASMVSDCMKIMSPKADKADVKLVTHVPSSLPDLIIDPKRGRQIILNLLSNAVKFTPEGGHVTVDADVTSHGSIEITVTDTGIGIAEEDIPKALEAFGQIDSSLSRKYDGTGLGLPLTKRLIEGNDGTMEIDSTVDKGTKITIRFPANRVGK